ncbi:hypothetical protein HW561_07215 [Rhodobacteraceae bacterium B1Z28]|uniref:Amidase n=1 Tax=Ruegeria haliotis TaxID=2747601 RepID=A0ABX2PPA3_9RHOB|nr:hypothetical protein [Ruegeria haliotis]NVO55574.1 hypothetical protein [Ruegeria haliotis]
MDLTQTSALDLLDRLLHRHLSAMDPIVEAHDKVSAIVMPSISPIRLPCLAAPAGFGPTGLPMGIQVFGSRGSDQRL